MGHGSNLAGGVRNLNSFENGLCSQIKELSEKIIMDCLVIDWSQVNVKIVL
jgi:hypothetical protein